MKKTLRIMSIILCLMFVFSSYGVGYAVSKETGDNGTVYFNFDTPDSVNDFFVVNNTNIAYLPKEKAVSFTTVEASGDPFVHFSMENGASYSADEYKYIVMTYKNSGANSSAATQAELFYCAGSVTGATGGVSLKFPVTKSNSYESAIIDLSSAAKWTGKIHLVRLDYLSDCGAGDVFCLSSFALAKTVADANLAASTMSDRANEEAAEKVISYDFKSAEDVKAITAPGNGVLPGDLDGDGEITTRDSLLLKKYIAGLTEDVDLLAADVNGDGDISPLDSSALKKYLVGAEGAELSASCAKIAYDSEKNAASITALEDDPTVTITFDEPIDTSIRRYAVISYIIDETENTDLGLAFSNGQNDTVEMTADGIRHAKRLTYATSTSWTGSVSSVEISTELSKGEVLYIDSVIFTETAAKARSVASEKEEGVEEGGANLIFDSADKLSVIRAANSTTVSYNASESAAALKVTGKAGDPQALIDFSASGFSADEYKYIVVTYKVPSGTSSAASGTELFLCAGDITGATADCSVKYNPVKDGKYHYEIITLANASYWSGDIHNIRFDYFSNCTENDIMYLDSVCLVKTKASAVALGKERVSLKNGSSSGDVGYTSSTSLNGKDADIVYYDASGVTSDEKLIFSGQMTAVIAGEHEQFNRFHFDYSTNAIVRGIAYYTCDGVEKADEFFLENTGGTTRTFTSLITDYFAGKYATDLTVIELYTINTSSATVKISGITEEQYTRYIQSTYYLTNSRYKVGVDLFMGGGINYLEDFLDNNPNYGNILNNFDVGRLIQQSYYGIDHAPYEMGYWTDRAWGYNPVQGGDKLNNNSRIVDFEFRGSNCFYVKARPMDWGQVNKATPSYMENVYTLTTEYVHVYNKFVDFSGYTHTEGWQELPAFYTISALNNFSYYNGSSPWTGDRLITRSDLVFWGAVSNQAFDLKSTSEFWSAWTDNSGFGVGLYVPGVYTYHAGKFCYDGSADPAAGSTNYVAPRRYLTLICGKPLEYSYLVASGSLGQIRETFKNNRGLINNSGLENYNR